MSDIEALQKFAKFQATFPWTTVVNDEDQSYTGGSTDPYTREQLLHTFLRMALHAKSGPPVGGSDFEVLDDLRTPKGQLRRQISALRRGGGLVYRERLAGRLDILLDALEEEGERWTEDSPDSLRQMLLLLQTVPHFRCPTVTVTPSATFRAQWQAGHNQHFAVDFLPDGQVRFVVFAPDPCHPDRVERVSGSVSRADLMRTVRPYRVHRWAADAGT